MASQLVTEQLERQSSSRQMRRSCHQKLIVAQVLIAFEKRPRRRIDLPMLGIVVGEQVLRPV